MATKRPVTASSDSAPVTVSVTVTPVSFASPCSAVTAAFHVKRIFSLASARSAMILDARNWSCLLYTSLAGAEIELVSLVAREGRLAKALEAHLADTAYDYVFIDCPPSLGLLTVNAFVAAREVFIPIQCEYYALEGLSQLLRNAELIKTCLLYTSRCV